MDLNVNTKMNTNPLPDAEGAKAERKQEVTPVTRIGIGLLVLSLLLWVLLAVVPFLPVGGKTKAAAALSVFAAAEVTFYLGLLLAGKAAVSKFRQRFRLKRPTDTSPVRDDKEEAAKP